MVSWEYWHYCECQDPTTTGSGTQAMVIDPEPAADRLQRQAGEARRALASPIRRSSPARRRAGSFDPATRTFSFTYSTKGPAGKKFARRAKHSGSKRATSSSARPRSSSAGPATRSGYRASVQRRRRSPRSAKAGVLQGRSPARGGGTSRVDGRHRAGVGRPQRTPSCRSGRSARASCRGCGLGASTAAAGRTSRRAP